MDMDIDFLKEMLKDPKDAVAFLEELRAKYRADLDKEAYLRGLETVVRSTRNNTILQYVQKLQTQANNRQKS